MREPKHNIHLNNKYFDAIYPVDFYNDKKVFYDSGARQFFTIYHIISHRKHILEIEETSTGNKIQIKDEREFKQWVNDNYPMYLNYLENFN